MSKRRSILAIGILLIISVVIITFGPSTPFANRNPLGESFPNSTGQSLDGKIWHLPQDLAGREVILLVGYVQETQFDIDRWLIGLDMRQVEVETYEVPSIKGIVPSIISEQINRGMRSGIPAELWASVVTVYEDGELIQRFTGNERPRNARVILLDRKGNIRFFTDEGFSIKSLNQLISALNQETSKVHDL